MHHARLDRSPRLQRVYDLLSDGAEHSTRDIIRDAEVCAVNSVISELRENGCYIERRQVTHPVTRQPIHLYRMPFGNPNARGA